MNIFLAILPILILLIGMLVFNKSAMIMGPVALGISGIFAILRFNATLGILGESVWTGVWDGLAIVFLIFAAFVTLTMMQETGGMLSIQDSISGFSDDVRVHLVLIAVLFGAFLEGAAGAGAPAALTAPFLVGLGLNPIVAATAALMANSVPVSWGGAGVTTIAGIGPIEEYISIMEASGATGMIHMIGALFVPALVVRLIYGKKSLKGIKKFLLITGITWGIGVFVASNYIGPEITSKIAAIIALIVAAIYLLKIGIKTPSEYKFKPKEEHSSKRKNEIPIYKAASPYFLMLILFAVFSFTIDLDIRATWGVQPFEDYTIYVGTVILFCALIGGFIIGNPLKKFAGQIKTSFFKIIPAAIAMTSLLALAEIMVNTGMMRIIALTLADISGIMYPGIALSIGALGSFITGTNLGSNIMFSPLHLEAALALEQNIVPIFAAQNAGGAIGNMICPNNVVAVATTVGILGKEGTLIKKVFPAFITIFAVYFVISLLLTHIILV